MVSIYRENGKPNGPRLIVADFRTGMLLAEELIDTVRRIFDTVGSDDAGKSNIRRVVLDDVGAIGVSYPLLKHSVTTGDLFLSAFVHVMKNKGVDLLMVGTTGDLPDSNHMVHQACSLADGVLRTSVGTVFGDKYVLLTGDGMVARQPNRGESPPVVLLPSPNSPKLMVNAQLLDEFVGFDSGQIERPRIVLHLYQESNVQRRYNAGLLRRLQERYGAPYQARKQLASTGVQLIEFSPGGINQLDPSEWYNDQERPRDHTAVRIIDEFERGIDGRGRADEPDPTCFMRNVLLMAYRSDVLVDDKELKHCNTWQGIRRIVAGLPAARGLLPAGADSNDGRYGRRFCFSRVAPETLSCLVLDALTTSGELPWADKTEFPFPGQFSSPAAIVPEFTALHDLMFNQVWAEGEREHLSEDRLKDLWKEPLCRDAVVYVAWYSQIRELLVREPRLARRLRVRSLPGKGFRGDWYVRVEPGSVSLRLGDTIWKHLVSAGEDYERFREGLSLPVAPAMLESELLAWPGAVPTTEPMTMRVVQSIWKAANRRSCIADYRRFNHLLSTVGEVLAGKYLDLREQPTTGDTVDLAEDLVDRLPRLVESLRTAGGA